MGGIRQATVMRVLRSAAVAALALGTLAALPLVGGLAGQGAARAQDTDLPSQGLAAITAYMGALVSGDMAAIEAVLAPEFQAMRSEGGGYDRASYLSQGLPHIAEMPEVTDLVATASDGLLVVRYTLRAKVSTNGVDRTATAPRLTVFRREGDAWLVVAHANFSQIED